MLGESANLGDLWECYRAALQLETPEGHQVEAVFIGRSRHAKEIAPWEVPVQNIESGYEENDPAAESNRMVKLSEPTVEMVKFAEMV